MTNRATRFYSETILVRQYSTAVMILDRQYSTAVMMLVRRKNTALDFPFDMHIHHCHPNIYS